MTDVRGDLHRHRVPVSGVLALWLLLCALPLPAGAAPGASPEVRVFRIGTGGLSGVYYPVGLALAEALMDNWPRACGPRCAGPPLLAIAQRSSGSVSNVRDLAAGRVEAALMQADVARWATTGTGYFAGEPPLEGLRAIGWLYPETLHLVARADSGIAGFADLHGRRVSLAEPGSGTLATARVALAAHGLTESDLDPLYLSLKEAAEALRAGRLDAFFVVVGAPAQELVELARERAIALVPLEPEALARVVAREPALAAAELPDGLYPGTRAISTLQVKALLATHASVDAELVRRVTALLWNEGTLERLSRRLPAGYPVPLEAAVADLPLPLHPGARAFYLAIGQAP